MKALEMKFDDIMHYAIKQKITDIHIDPHHKSLIFRRHKVHHHTFKMKSCDALYSFLKFKANIFLESFGSLQTGSFDYIVDYKTYYLRYAILENRTRKHGVLRILNIVPIESLDDCGIEKKDILKIRNMFQKSHGLVLFSGKTGAGKSTTMFAGLNEIHDKEIFTLENPIEKVYPHLIQMECKDESLSEHITQLLRHDPDILVIGEIRTSKELQQAIRASLSGHLLMSTIHAGNIEEVIHRLQDLSISQYDLQNVLKGIVFQKIDVRDKNVNFNFEIKTEEEITCYIK